MAGGRKAAHVHPDLGDDHLGGALADTGNGHEPTELVIERGDHPLHLGVHRRDLGGEVVDVRQMSLQHHRVVSPEPADQSQA